ncbi:flagellar hook-length control protein FliK [Oceanibium sediminis]|uniref:flagellar hook-length control protein FliK n=1 Tax=Oceanibium sediminis TaxID=2026339 RepID=UPI00130028F5|nr:flagellar hook-length control protein FliK [Oceanibium sediminis]
MGEAALQEAVVALPGTGDGEVTADIAPISTGEDGKPSGSPVRSGQGDSRLPHGLTAIVDTIGERASSGQEPASQKGERGNSPTPPSSEVARIAVGETPAALNGRVPFLDAPEGVMRSPDLPVPPETAVAAARSGDARPSVISTAAPMLRAAISQISSAAAPVPDAEPGSATTRDGLRIAAPELAPPAAKPAAAAPYVPMPASRLDSVPAPEIGKDRLPGVLETGNLLAPRAVPATPAALQAVTPLPPGSPPPDVLVAQVTSQISSQGRGEWIVRLDPPELGMVRIGLSLGENGQLNVLLSADRPDVEALLRRHTDQLNAALTGAGYAGVSLSFGDGGDQKASDASGQMETLGPHTPGKTEAEVTHVRLNGPGGLDLRL